MAALPPTSGDGAPPAPSAEGAQLRNYQRLGHLRKVFPDVPLFVLQCCANDADGLTLRETQDLFQRDYRPHQARLIQRRTEELHRLTQLLPPEEGDSPADPATKPADKKKKSRLQGGAMAKPAPRAATTTAAPPVPAAPLVAWAGLLQLASLPDHVRVRPGLVLIKNALSLQLQQQFAEVSFALGTPGTGHPFGGGWYGRRPDGSLVLNSGGPGAEFGAFLDGVGAFPPQYRSLCRHCMAVACRLCPDMPSMDPSICLVNYYPNTKGIYWHRDNSSPEKVMAAAGSPVISVSIGDACDFAYKDESTDPERCVVLASGDVLVFGGPSRLILHSVPKIYPRTAPKGLRMPLPGRLNLTFRQQDFEPSAP